MDPASSMSIPGEGGQWPPGLQPLLQKTSRTFALTIPLLPEPLRTEVAVAYLLFRIIDTFEDADRWPAARRIAALSSFAALMDRPNEDGDRERLQALTTHWMADPPVDHLGYLELLAATPLVVAWCRRLRPAAAAQLRHHVARSARGMIEVIEETDGNGMLQLQTLQDLRDYCYVVAGIVGEMLTELFLLQSPSLETVAADLRGRSAEFGEALQLVNILKDAQADAAEGRVYLPREVLLAEVFALARKDLARAAEYTKLLRAAGGDRGMVAFNTLNTRLAIGTLHLLRDQGPGAKMARLQVTTLAAQVLNAVDTAGVLFPGIALMAFDIIEALNERAGENFSLHEKYLNPQMVRVLKTIGFDRHYTRAEGPYLYDKTGARYLDLLSGFGVFALGRNHPTVKKAITDILNADLPNLVQMDASLLSGLLAERLLAHTPGQEKVFFCNSGTEAVEAAIKLARAATRRSRLVFCDHAFHGLTMGALTMNGDAGFRDGFGPLLADAARVPWNDLAALEAVLSTGDVAAFFIEPIQGKGVNLPGPGYLREAARLCKKYGALLVADEIQTGLGRTGKFLAIEHEDVDADLILVAKALSGGFVPVGAVIGKKWIFDRTFDRMDRAVVHGSTFGKNNLAMAAGLATLAVLEDEELIENAARRGDNLLRRLGALVDKYELLKEVRGRGLMLALEFGAPRSLGLRAAWALMEKATKGLFCQSVIIPLFSRHRILSQVAGHEMYVIKLLPPLVLSQEDEDWIVTAFDDVIADCHKAPSSVWDLATTMAGNALKGKAGT